MSALLREDQLARAGDAEPVLLVTVHDDDLLRPAEQVVAAHGRPRRGRGAVRQRPSTLPAAVQAHRGARGFLPSRSTVARGRTEGDDVGRGRNVSPNRSQPARATYSA